jgi:hypothetical protein
MRKQKENEIREETKRGGNPK